MLYPPRYKAAFAFSDLSKPSLHWPALRLACHASRMADRRPYHVPCDRLCRQLRWNLYAGGTTIPLQVCLRPATWPRMQTPGSMPLTLSTPVGLNTCDDACGPLNILALLSNPSPYPDGVSGAVLLSPFMNPIRYIVREAPYQLHNAQPARSRRVPVGIHWVLVPSGVDLRSKHIRSRDFVSQ